MKKVLFSLYLLFIGTIAFAQLSKGSLLVTGSASGNKRNYDGSGTSANFLYFGPFTQTTFTVAPQVSYMLSNRFAIGLEGGYTKQKYESIDDNLSLNGSTWTYKSNSHKYTAGQFLRYYIPLRQNFYLYFQESALYYSGKGEYSNVSTSVFSTTESKDSYDVTGYRIALKPGIQYFLSNRVAIDVSVDILKYTEQKETYTTRTDDFSEFEVNLIPNSVTLGVSYRFGGGK